MDCSELFPKLTHFHRKIAFYKFSGFELLVSKVICLQQLHYFIQDLSLSAQKLSVINYKFQWDLAFSLQLAKQGILYNKAMAYWCSVNYETLSPLLILLKITWGWTPRWLQVALCGFSKHMRVWQYEPCCSTFYIWFIHWTFLIKETFNLGLLHK